MQVDVSVLDRDRRTVRGLAASDFTVLEDGRERPVVAFSAVDLAASTDTTPFWMRDVSPDVVSNIAPLEGRLVVILMDRTIRPQAQPLGRRIAEAAVNALGPGDLAAVIYSGPGVPQNFTPTAACCSPRLTGRSSRSGTAIWAIPASATAVRARSKR